MEDKISIEVTHINAGDIVNVKKLINIKLK
jgi:hypothetical protein